tara:strand:- start:63 stop:419 length:357 start_codon:yes stop_codon:yes gene_type:complete
MEIFIQDLCSRLAFDRIVLAYLDFVCHKEGFQILAKEVIFQGPVSFHKGQRVHLGTRGADKPGLEVLFQQEPWAYQDKVHPAYKGMEAHELSTEASQTSLFDLLHHHQGSWEEVEMQN